MWYEQKNFKNATWSILQQTGDNSNVQHKLAGLTIMCMYIGVLYSCIHLWSGLQDTLNEKIGKCNNMYTMLIFVKREEYYICLYFQKESEETTFGRGQGWKVVIFCCTLFYILTVYLCRYLTCWLLFKKKKKRSQREKIAILNIKTSEFDSASAYYTTT